MCVYVCVCIYAYIYLHIFFKMHGTHFELVCKYLTHYVLLGA